MALQPCDCLNRCGDDSRVAAGRVQACANWRAWHSRARIVGVSRDASDPNVLVVHYDSHPSDDDLRALHDFDRWPAP
jgi:hypothetical protein